MFRMVLKGNERSRWIKTNPRIVDSVAPTINIHCAPCMCQMLRVQQSTKQILTLPSRKKLGKGMEIYYSVCYSQIEVYFIDTYRSMV